jgi:hypothetical protein
VRSIGVKKVCTLLAYCMCEMQRLVLEITSPEIVARCEKFSKIVQRDVGLLRMWNDEQTCCRHEYLILGPNLARTFFSCALKLPSTTSAATLF